MKNPVIKEVKLGIYKLRILRAFLGASVMFLTTFFVLMLINLPTISIAASVSVLFFVTEMVVYARQDPLKIIEGKYDGLKEELTTMGDTLDEENEIVTDLRRSVTRKVKNTVDMSDFVNYKRVLSRLLLIFFLSFAVILVASLNIKIVDADNLLGLGQKFISDIAGDALRGSKDKIKVYASENDLTQRFKKLAATAGVAAGEQEGGDIFGSSEIVQLGNEKINIEIRPTDFEVSVDDYEPPEKKDFKDTPFQEEVAAEQAFGLEERIPQRSQEIVKRYFEELAKT